MFEPKIDIPSGVERFDVSQGRNEKVMAYIEPDSEGSTTYKLHIQGENKVVANTDSSGLFDVFSKVTSIEGLEYFDTSKVIDMSGLFNGCHSLVTLDLSNFDFTKVTSFDDMFSEVLVNC